MQGEPVLVAKALSIAICIIAQRRKRKVLVVKYSYSHDLFRLHNIEHDKKDLLDFLGEAEMGGNDEDSMFRWLFDEIMPSKAIIPQPTFFASQTLAGCRYLKR